VAQFTQHDEDAAIAKQLGLPAKEHPDTSLRMLKQILNPALLPGVIASNSSRP
jgi:hypothetical protein